MIIEPMQKDTDFSKQGIWGDIVCSHCFLALNTITVEEEGIYEFVKVRELDSKEKK